MREIVTIYLGSYGINIADRMLSEYLEDSKSEDRSVIP